MRFLVAGDLCPSCATVAKRRQERAARWERIERTAAAILAGQGNLLPIKAPVEAAVDWAEALVAELDRRRAAEEAGNG